MRIISAVALLMLSLGTVTGSAATPPAYTYLTMDYPAAFNTGVFGINNVGQTSGTYFGSDGIAHAFIRTAGKFRSLDFPEANRTFGFGINDAGWIVGYYIDLNSVTHGFLYDGQKFTSIDYPQAKSTRASGINKSGQIVGSFIDSSGVSHGFLNQSGKFSVIDYPGAARAEAFGINDAGWIVGFYTDSKDGTHGFLNKAGVLTNIDAPRAQRTNPYAIDKSGRFAGSFVDSNGVHGFINDASYVKLNYPAAFSTFGFALNDAGQVVGQYMDEDSVAHGFMAVTGQQQLPQISERVDPPRIASGTPGFLLSVRGIGFAPGAIVEWNGDARQTTFEDASHLTVTIPAADIAKPSTSLITVNNPGPGGGTSNVVLFLVSGPTTP